MMDSIKSDINDARVYRSRLSRLGIDLLTTPTLGDAYRQLSSESTQWIKELPSWYFMNNIEIRRLTNIIGVVAYIKDIKAWTSGSHLGMLERLTGIPFIYEIGDAAFSFGPTGWKPSSPSRISNKIEDAGKVLLISSVKSKNARYYLSARFNKSVPTIETNITSFDVNKYVLTFLKITENGDAQ